MSIFKRKTAIVTLLFSSLKPQVSNNFTLILFLIKDRKEKICLGERHV